MNDGRRSQSPAPLSLQERQGQPPSILVQFAVSSRKSRDGSGLTRNKCRLSLFIPGLTWLGGWGMLPHEVCPDWVLELPEFFL